MRSAASTAGRSLPSQTEHFLFEIDGDTLRLCTRPMARPESITAEKGSGNTVYTLRRVRAKD